MNVTWMMYGFCLCCFIAGICMALSGDGKELAGGLRPRSLSPEEAQELWRRRLRQLAEKMGWERIRQEQRRIKAENEVAEAIAYLKNAVAMGRGESMSADLILTELSELDGSLSPVYMKMLHYLRLNEKEKVIEIYDEACGSELGRDFARLLLQWEELAPAMLVETLTSYQKTLREVRITKQKRRDEMVSDMVYLPVISNVMLVLINFIYVAYFIDQREMLLNMFG